ncbi:hypothetical protein TB2_032156 [Malus domestica]
MLAKVSWRVLHKPDSMIGVVLRDKYFPNSSFLEANKQNISSWEWKGILLGRQVLNRGLWWRVGDGESIRVASNPWIPKPDSFKSLMRFRAPNVKVCDLFPPDKQGWNMETLGVLVERVDMELIQTIPISRRGCSDKRIWHYTKNEIYSICWGYYVAMKMMKNEEFGRKGGRMSSSAGVGEWVWKTIWSLLVPNKIWLFIWKACCMGVVDFLEGWERNEAGFNGTRILPHIVVELWRKQVDEFRESAMVEGMEHRDGRVLGRGSGCGWS